MDTRTNLQELRNQSHPNSETKTCCRTIVTIDCYDKLKDMANKHIQICFVKIFIYL